MTIARSAGAFIGTDESTGAAVAAAASSVGTQKDVLGDDTSTGVVGVYLSYTPAAGSTGDITVTLYGARVTGQHYVIKTAAVKAYGQAASHQMVFLGKVPAHRYMKGTVANGTGVALANVSLLYDLEKLT